MSTLDKSLVLAAALMLTHGATAVAQEEAASKAPVAVDVPVAQDLTAVIALQGQPCGKVVRAVKTGEDAYLATCQDENRYRIFVNAEGRVVVAKVE